MTAPAGEVDGRDPLVSVIVPVRDADDFARPLLVALAALDGADHLELLVVDDHSRDDTAALLREHAGLVPGVRLLSATAPGVAAARNQAVGVARGTYLWFADCDDTWSPTIVSEMLALARRTDADIVVCNATTVVADGAGDATVASLVQDAPRAEVIDGRAGVRRLLRGEMQGHLWNKLFRRSLFDHQAFPDLRAHSDLAVSFGLCCESERIALLPRSLYEYVLRPGSLSNQRDYAWTDLERCLALADAAAERAGAEVAATDRLLFKYRNVVVPLENESVRREAWTPAPLIAQVRARNRARVDLAEVVRIARGRHLALAAQVLAVRWLPRVYRRLYRRHRRRQWSSLDRG